MSELIIIEDIGLRPASIAAKILFESMENSVLLSKEIAKIELELKIQKIPASKRTPKEKQQLAYGYGFSTTDIRAVLSKLAKEQAKLGKNVILDVGSLYAKGIDEKYFFKALGESVNIRHIYIDSKKNILSPSLRKKYFWKQMAFERTVRSDDLQNIEFAYISGDEKDGNREIVFCNSPLPEIGVCHPNREKTLTIMVGLPGSGKSTAAKQLYKKNSQYLMGPTTVLSSDAIREEFKKCGDPIDNAELFKLIREEKNIALYNGHNVIVDATSVSKKARADLLRNKKYDNTTQVAFMMCTSIADCKELNRLRERSRQVPQHVIDDMHNNFYQPTLAEGFDKIIYGKVVKKGREWEFEHATKCELPEGKHEYKIPF